MSSPARRFKDAIYEQFARVSKALGSGVDWLISHSLLPVASIIIEPAKVLFLNNAINHGVLTPLGLQQAQGVLDALADVDAGADLIETNTFSAMFAYERNDLAVHVSHQDHPRYFQSLVISHPET